MSDIKKAFAKSIYKLALPLARVLLRYGVSYKEFAEFTKAAFVEAASEHKLDKRKQSISRISVLTGLSRVEVTKVVNAPPVDEQEMLSNNRAARVINGWRTDKKYLDSKKQPKILPITEGDINFSNLVKEHSGHLPYRAILDELNRVKAVEELPDGKLRLLASSYVPESSPTEKIKILGDATYDLIKTLEHNLEHGGKAARTQLTVSYDNLPQETAAELKRLLSKKSKKMILEVNEWLATQDRDMNQDVKGEGKIRAGVGVYYLEDELSPKDEDARDKG